MMKLILPILILFAFQCAPKSQVKYKDTDNEDVWDVYMAQYDEGAGSTVVNMSLINRAPVNDLQYIVITGVTYEDCTSDGFPTPEEFNILYQISDDIEKTISGKTEHQLAGTFTYQCERLDYIYLNDTIDIRNNLKNLYSSKYSSYKYYINIRPDREWEAYLSFLYPNEETQEYMSNEKVLIQLQSAGDSLTKARKVDHWIYFNQEDSRKKYVEYVKNQGFIIESEERINESEYPYQLHISRVDYIDPASINKLTLELKRKAKGLQGDYDGWETFVIKE